MGVSPEPSPLNDNQVRALASAIYADLDARLSRRLAADPPPADGPRPFDRTVAEAMTDRGACPHGVTGGRALRPAHGTPLCALCRREWLTAYRAGDAGR